MLKYTGISIVFQEVPGEVTLAVNISGCPIRCPGCHSKYLWRDEGRPLTVETLMDEIRPYINFITCVCFMGGDQDYQTLCDLVSYLNKHTDLNIAMYSGRDHIAEIDMDLFHMLDYVKIGHYDEKLGPLSSRTTNQRMYFHGQDITYKFWRDKK